MKSRFALRVVPKKIKNQVTTTLLFTTVERLDDDGVDQICVKLMGTESTGPCHGLEDNEAIFAHRSTDGPTEKREMLFS